MNGMNLSGNPGIVQPIQIPPTLGQKNFMKSPLMVSREGVKLRIVCDDCRKGRAQTFADIHGMAAGLRRESDGPIFWDANNQGWFKPV
jgi:hypothetical protein